VRAAFFAVSAISGSVRGVRSSNLPVNAALETVLDFWRGCRKPGGDSWAIMVWMVAWRCVFFFLGSVRELEFVPMVFVLGVVRD